MKNKFSVNKNWWFTLAKKTRVIFIWIDENINKHFNVRRRHESNVFVEFNDVFEILNKIFKNHDKKRNVRKIYNKFKMKSNQIFSKFYSKFILLINQLRNCCKIDTIDFADETLANVLEMKNVKCNNIYLNMLELKTDFRKIRKHFVI